MKNVIALALTALMASACSSSEEPPAGTAAGAATKTAPKARATRVEVATVHPTRHQSHIVRPGEVAGAREAHLASALGGFVERVAVETGQRVKKNKVIAYVDTRTHAAQARLTKVELDEATRELARLERLGDAVASARVDAAKSRLARAKAQHALSTTRQAQAVIRAPFAGAIVGLDVERGEVVAPGAPIARLIQLDPIHVSVSVTDRDVGSLEVGGDAVVTTAATAAPMAGKIHRIEPAADLETRTFLVVVELPNPERRLLPGMIAQVSFSGEHAAEALFIPQDFLVTRLDGNGVFVADGEVARWRPLQLGTIAGTQVEVVKGLRPGERVVVLGHRSLEDGDPLIIAREGKCCTDGRVVFPGDAETAAKKPAPEPEKPVERARKKEGTK